MTDSTLIPSYNFVGFEQYEKLWKIPNWYRSLQNLAIFGGLYVFGCILIGLFLAILIDQKIRIEGLLRPIYLYPMALSFIVSGTAWKWFLNPGIGLESTMHSLGFESFSFDWIVNSKMAIYTVVIAAIWQTSGFVMAIFLAGLRGINEEVIKAAQIDGAPLYKIYLKIIIPQLSPAMMSAFIILAHLAIKSYDLVIALTNGGPGNSTILPSVFMYSYTFTRTRMAVGSASSIIMLLMIASVLIPYILSEVKTKK